MNGKFTIVLKSPMGPKEGFLYLKGMNSSIEGILECLGEKHTFSGMISEDGALLLKGILKAPLGEEPFMILGTIEKKVLTANFKRRNESYELSGLQIDDNR
ncbi:hypothetical protein [Aminipila luticellarii]|uniref:Uncharacterized protein n=1 Tax=Aminipila luticellarii TaxID=2507160 RepID=A0A410PYC9_9FIRM|nr:hypothetical protein [Aminipila luticellarii]QAT43959.1 hypothetical protein EQM06_12400 [Aminipila luticellarii]